MKDLETLTKRFVAEVKNEMPRLNFSSGSLAALQQSFKDHIQQLIEQNKSSDQSPPAFGSKRRRRRSRTRRTSRMGSRARRRRRQRQY